MLMNAYLCVHWMYINCSPVVCLSWLSSFQTILKITVITYSNEQSIISIVLAGGWLPWNMFPCCIWLLFSCWRWTDKAKKERKESMEDINLLHYSLTTQLITTMTVEWSCPLSKGHRQQVTRSLTTGLMAVVGAQWESRNWWDADFELIQEPEGNCGSLAGENDNGTLIRRTM